MNTFNIITMIETFTMYFILELALKTVSELFEKNIIHFTVGVTVSLDYSKKLK